MSGQYSVNIGVTSAGKERLDISPKPAGNRMMLSVFQSAHAA
jgi:hypothetical protein